VPAPSCWQQKPENLKMIRDATDAKVRDPPGFAKHVASRLAP